MICVLQEVLEEIEDEVAAQAAKPEPIPLRPKVQERTEVAQHLPVPGGEGSEKVLTVSVNEDIYDVLKGIAARNRIPVGTLVRDVLASYVKYK